MDTQAASEMSNIEMQQPSVITYGHYKTKT